MSESLVKNQKTRKNIGKNKNRKIAGKIDQKRYRNKSGQPLRPTAGKREGVLLRHPPSKPELTGSP